jgi:hypothetical protein
MPDILPNLTEMDDHIAAIRENLHDWSSKQPHIPVLRTRT